MFLRILPQNLDTLIFCQDFDKREVHNFKYFRMKPQEIITSAIFLHSLVACKAQIEPMQTDIEIMTEKNAKHKIYFTLPIKICNYSSIL